MTKRRKQPSANLRNDIARSAGDDPAVAAKIPQKYSAGRQVAELARTWVGTPYHHQASLRGVGCDCLGLLRGIWRDVVGPEPERMPNYSPAWDEVSKRDDMATVFGKHLVAADDRLAAGDFRPGDVLLFRMRPEAVAKHCGIVTGDRFVHAHSGHGTVEIELTDWWRKRLVGLFMFPGVK